MRKIIGRMRTSRLCCKYWLISVIYISLCPCLFLGNFQASASQKEYSDQVTCSDGSCKSIDSSEVPSSMLTDGTRTREFQTADEAAYVEDTAGEPTSESQSSPPSLRNERDRRNTNGEDDSSAESPQMQVLIPATDVKEKWGKDSMGKEDSVDISKSDESSVKMEAFVPTLSVLSPTLDEYDDDDEVGDKQGSGSEDETGDVDEGESEPVPFRRKFFPLLYTFHTLFSSFLSEFGDVSSSQDRAYNMTAAARRNESVGEETKDSNSTSNGTELMKKTRFQCAIKNFTFSIAGKVKIVNSTELLDVLNLSKNQKASTCVLVMFYAPWCHFCAHTAPHYNALARAYPYLDVLAVDTSHFSYLNARFGTVAVPNVMLFHSRSAVRFNHTLRELNNFIQFVKNNTGLEPDRSIKLEPLDFVGPLSSVVVKRQDWLLWLSWAFVTLCSGYGFVKSRYGQSFITRLGVLWQEHQHIE